MMASRGMGDISPSKMPKGKRKARRDSDDFTQYKEGGKVNAAGNYTKPDLRKRIVAQVKAAATHGTEQVSDTFLKLQLKVSALLSTLLQRVRNALAKKPGSSS